MLFQVIKTVVILMVSACAGVAMSFPARADSILTSNLATPSNGWNAGVQNDQWVAAPFRTTAELTRITAVTLDVYANGQYYGGDIYAAIWSTTAGGAPASSVHTLYQGGFGAWSNSFLGLSVDLQPNTDYAVVVGGAGFLADTSHPFFTLPGGVDWAMSSDRATQAHVGDGFVPGTWYSQNQGASWSFWSLDTQHLAVSAEAGSTRSQAVPEIDPAGLTAPLSLVAGFFAVLERRQRRRS